MADGVDYVSFEATAAHISGATLSIDQGGPGQREVLQTVKVSALASASASGDLPATVLVERPALTVRSRTICGSESIHEEGIVSVGQRHEGTIAYEVRFAFTGRWKGQSWTFSPNRILLVNDKP